VTKLRQCSPPVVVAREGDGGEGPGDGARRRIRATLASMDATAAKMPGPLCALLEASGAPDAWRSQLETMANAPKLAALAWGKLRGR
jgi:hypothetical protein